MSRVAIGDWNGDGVPDVVIGNLASGDIGVVYGPLDREGALTVQRFWPRDRMPFAGRIRQPVLADWDGDGLLDLAFVGTVGDRRQNDGNGVYWMRNIGTATEPALDAPRPLVADRKGWTTNGVCVADWNGDGRLDLIATRTHAEQSRPGGPRVTLHNKVWVYLRHGR